MVARLAVAAGEKLTVDALDEMGVTNGGPAGNGSDGPDRLAAALNEGSTVTVLVSVDLLRSSEARASLLQLSNLLQLLRLLGKAPALQILFDRANQLGAWDMGVAAGALPGLQAIADDTVRAALARNLAAEIRHEPGADLDGMLDLCAAGQMGVLYLVGADR